MGVSEQGTLLAQVRGQSKKTHIRVPPDNPRESLKGTAIIPFYCVYP